jgi:hypothetical protein
MDEKSTPLSSLNNKPDDTDTVNQILSKYNTLQNNNGSIPAKDNNIPKMEQEFEDRNLNSEMYKLKADNSQYAQHQASEKQRINSIQQQQQQQQNIEYEDEDDVSYDEYEIEELPLWKKIVNEIRIPLFIFLSIILVMSSYSNKLLITKVPFLGNEYNDVNTIGFLIKAFVCALIAYVLVRFIRV